VAISALFGQPVGRKSRPAGRITDLWANMMTAMMPCSLTTLGVAIGALTMWLGSLPAAPHTATAPAVPQARPESDRAASPAAAAPELTWETLRARFGGDEWITRPNQSSPLGFTLPVEIEEVLAKGGMRAKKGDVLVRARDGEVLAALAVQKARAENETEVDNAKAALELAQIKFDAQQQARDQNAGNPNDYEERRVGLASAKIGVEAAVKRLEEQRLQAKQLEEQAKRYRITAPFDCIVDEVVCEVGQSANDNQPIMRVVSIDPLWVDTPVATAETLRFNLSTGDAAWVLLDVPGDEPVVARGKVLYVSPVADSAGGTRRVRVEFPNPRAFPAGTRAAVRFREPAQGWYLAPASTPEAAPR
jgi:RND family efflux transporter MFP subunit